jgi:hypothetical protein
MSTDAPGGNSRCGYRLDWMISVDDHILEPAGIWQDRLPAQYLEAGPQVVVKDGTDYWRYEGRLFPTSGLRGTGRIRGRAGRFRRLVPGGQDASALRDALSTALGEPAVVQLAMLIGYYSMIGIARAALGVKTGST